MVIRSFTEASVGAWFVEVTSEDGQEAEVEPVFGWAVLEAGKMLPLTWVEPVVLREGQLVQVGEGMAWRILSAKEAAESSDPDLRSRRDTEALLERERNGRVEGEKMSYTKVPRDHTEFGGDPAGKMIPPVRRADRVLLPEEQLWEIYATNPADSTSDPATAVIERPTS